MRRLLVCAALVLSALSAPPGASGQEGGERSPRAAAPSFTSRAAASDEAARLLRSRVNSERAWGAYLAGAYGLKENAPLVVELLEDPDGAAGDWEEAQVRRAALDCLIRLDAEVPAEKLLALYPHAPDEVVILLARTPGQNAAALLSLFTEETPGARWVAVANLLAEARARGFAARLLAGLKIQATVYVYDREAARGYGGGHGHGCGGTRHFEPAPVGFPPAGRYELNTSGVRGSVVLTGRRHTVYYVRTGPESGQAYYSDCGNEVKRDAYRVEYLADLLGTAEEEVGLEARPFHEVVCREARECRRKLAALRDETARTYAVVLERLSAAGLLDPAEAAELKPDLTFTLYDERDGRTSPLPATMSGVKILSVGGDAADGDSAPPPDAPR